MQWEIQGQHSSIPCYLRILSARAAENQWRLASDYVVSKIGRGRGQGRPTASTRGAPPGRQTIRRGPHSQASRQAAEILLRLCRCRWPGWLDWTWKRCLAAVFRAPRRDRHACSRVFQVARRPHSSPSPTRELAPPGSYFSWGLGNVLPILSEWSSCLSTCRGSCATPLKKSLESPGFPRLSISRHLPGSHSIGPPRFHHHPSASRTPATRIAFLTPPSGEVTCRFMQYTQM
jgi:hypothetical protein